MIRFLALTALLFVIPFAAYVLWVLASRRRLPEGEDWSVRVTVILCVFGAVFVLIGLVALVASSGTGAIPPVPGQAATAVAV